MYLTLLLDVLNNFCHIDILSAFYRYELFNMCFLVLSIYVKIINQHNIKRNFVCTSIVKLFCLFCFYHYMVNKKKIINRMEITISDDHSF